MAGLDRKHIQKTPRGSVLLFAIVLLSILAMLGVTFILLVRQSRTASSNTESSVEANFAAETGRMHALAALRGMVKRRAIVARKTYPTGTGTEYHVGVYNPADLSSFTYLDTQFYAWDGASTAGAPPLDIAFWHFEDNSAGATGPVLTTSGIPDVPMRYTTSLLAARANNGGEISIAKEVQGYTNDLYRDPPILNDPVKQLPRVSSVRGDYSIWFGDIGARLYAVPQSWGMDTTNVPGAVPTIDISKSILTELKALASMDELLDSDIDKLCTMAGTNSFANFPDLALHLDSLAPTVPDYVTARAQIEYYFRTQLDTAATTGNPPFPTVGEHPAAININTAPVEVIAASISQIPAEDTLSGAVLGISRGLAIAKRIVAKRPFLCRMDFEDFLAAHLMGSEDDATLAPPDDALTNVPDIDDTATPYVARIYYAISKRWGSGHTLTDPLFQSPELTLEGYMEIPGITTANSPELAMTIGAEQVWPNDPRYQKLRFDHFFLEDTNAPRASALLTPKEFNNFANSICTASYTDDVQKSPANSTGLLPDDVVIGPGPNGTLETAPQGDDYLMSEIRLGDTSTTTETGDDVADFDFDLGEFVIRPGPNQVLDTVPDAAQGDTVVFAGIAAGANGAVETVLPRGRPSYYSFFDDAAYGENFWSGLPQDKDMTNTVEEFNAVKHMKFYYRLKPKPPAPPPAQRDPANLSDLVAWSCYPDVGSERKPGFYQLSFDNWDIGAATPYIYGAGPMLTQGDPDEEDNQKYSTAKRISGATGTGDVSWSPQFSYRSRFFNVYVLGRGKIQGHTGPELNPADPYLRNNLKITGERRVECVYDALKDEVLYQRTPLSEKHSLAEP
jgi:hypothetical protein